MADLNLSPDYFEHRKTRRLRIRLGNDADIYPIRLWCYAAKFHPEDGVFRGYSRAEVCSIACGGGDVKEGMLEALLDGFLEIEGNDLKLHSWREHQGHLVVFKERAKKAAVARWTKYGELALKQQKDACSIASSELCNAPSSNEVGKEGKVEKVKQEHEENSWKVFVPVIERLFGKATSIRMEKRVMDLVPEFVKLGATVGELESRVYRYKKCWPGVACTLQAVLDHWNEIPGLREPKVEKLSEAPDVKWA